MTKKVNIMDEKWDYLIILDACRYDYFSELYEDYLQGKLEKVYSPATWTLGWCKKSFKEYYEDVVYVSANPYINSKCEAKGFDARKYFFKVIDVWDWGWDNELGTVHPKKVNEAVQKLKDKYPAKRFIIHYLQPHEPYLGYNTNAGFLRPQINSGIFLEGIQKNKTNKILDKSLDILGFLVRWTGLSGRDQLWNIFGGNPFYKIRDLLHLSPGTPMDDIRRKTGSIGLRKAYTENLKIVLEYVAKLVNFLSGIIIITADHGELLGEGGLYSHPFRSNNPFLIEVPWFTIKKEENRKTIEERKRIAQKIKQLKLQI